MSITAEVVRQLREETGAGMMDCKAALVETSGDMAKAREVLRKKGLAAAAKKASRTASRRRGRCATSPRTAEVGVLVEVNCETDFVAKTPDFQALVKNIAEHAWKHAPADVAALLEQPFAAGQTVAQAVQEKIAVIKENIVIRRFARFELAAGENGVVAAYIHPPAAKVGVLVELAAESDGAELQALAREVAMHVAAASPAAALYVSKDEVPAAVLANEKEIYRAQALAAGKPANVVGQDRRGQAQGVLRDLLPARAALRQRAQAHGRPAT